MFGPGIGSVFASRWKALWWAVGILATAYCTVPSQTETQQDKADHAATEKALQQLSDQLQTGGD
ncbi:MAG: hypothetical protein AB7F98_06960 [Novosphingobium sp.]